MAAGNLTYLFTNLTPLLRKGTMLNIAANPAITGAELRRIVAAEPKAPRSGALRRIGNLDVQLVRRDNQWTLYLADLRPIPQTTRDQWATAVSAPSVEWEQTQDGCSAWRGWTEG